MDLMETKHLTYNSLSECLAVVERMVSDLCDEHEIDSDLFGNMLVALTEAVTNAYVHGNGSDPQKSVDFSIDRKQNEITFKIKDQGAGFDYNNLPDPLAPENIEKENGRGIFLMRSLADEVEFNESGNEVEVMFQL